MAHILIVDDDPAAVASNAAAIETLGHSVSSSGTSSDAVEFIRRESPDLVVLEAILDGGFGGIALARTLAADYPELPLVMLTRADEHLSSEDRARQDTDGGWVPVRRYLEKPVIADVLAYEVEHLLPVDEKA
jgi:CheY-like chemotaxis protein